MMRWRANALEFWWCMSYVDFALDMYGDGKLAGHPKDAGRFVAEARFDAAVKQLSLHTLTDANNIAAIGYCFGDVLVEASCRRWCSEVTPLKGVVSFHSRLDTAQPAKRGEIKARVLVFNGEDDSFVKSTSIKVFRQEMTDAGADVSFVSLAGAKHSFTNPGATAIGKKFGLPLEYNKKAGQDSWQQMKLLFETLFK